ncbi:UDP-galactopyranose mutase [Pigmentiphaga soli]|uniref:UDP-galactopyranose mutase n=1 Tax=Pigmentiphaga soli TaxID=1007095 RepID=A0ABP8GXK2_9BURK
MSDPDRLPSAARIPFAVQNLAPRRTLLCFSHLRWDFVYQRPQHLMTRCAREHDVLFLEEPVDGDGPPQLDERPVQGHITVLVPRLPRGLDEPSRTQALKILLDQRLRFIDEKNLLLWYYTPMSMVFSAHLRPALVVYDCMDELSAFRGAPPELVEQERRLLAVADVVFTGGFSLYEAKRRLHPNTHPFPSSVDLAHFGAARACPPEPADQAVIPGPRLGFCGVIDERFDAGLLGELAARRPGWQFVMLGPIVKIDPATLARRPNIHYLGQKAYGDLPAYLAGWDVALMPFALNESTRFISPTKTPEYLAAGRPVVSTPIVDVVRGYGDSGMVRVADGVDAFERAIGAALADAGDRDRVMARADEILEGMSWDSTWSGMRAQMRRAGKRPGQRPGPRAGGGAYYDYLVVGAGFAGSVMAERLASQSGKRVLVIDRRPHIGGNAYDFYNEDGLLVHQYGPHIFHTNSPKVVEYLSGFTRWRPYEHRVLARVDGMLLPMPINLTTMSAVFGRALGPDEARALLASLAVPVADVKTSQDMLLSTVGTELYRKFFHGYTRKQWGLDPSQLDKSVAARVPTRLSTDDRYFTDDFQCMPLHGYTRMFEALLAHPNITVATGTAFADIRDDIGYGHLIYSGPVDEFFGYRCGRLPYRSLAFRHETLPQQQFQPVGVVNYPSPDVAYTRVTEYKHLTGQKHARTAITYEYPSAVGDPYYPVPRPENDAIFRQYRRLADATPDVTFVGRLATYRYYNMDQVVAQALSTYERLARLHGHAPADVADGELARTA